MQFQNKPMIEKQVSFTLPLTMHSTWIFDTLLTVWCRHNVSCKKCTPGQHYWLLSYIKISYAQNWLLSYITVKIWENFMTLFTRDNKFMMRHWLSWKMFLLRATYKLLISHKIFLFFFFFFIGHTLSKYRFVNTQNMLYILGMQYIM